MTCIALPTAGAAGDLALKDPFAAEVGVGRVDSRGEQFLADELRPLLVPCPVPAGRLGIGLIGQLWVVPEGFGRVVIAVDRQRIGTGGPAAVDHHRAGRVRGLNDLPCLAS